MSGSRPNVITIDGPAASGKSTVARRIAEATGRTYVDTGSLYRGITWQMLKDGLPVDEPGSVVAALDDIAVETSLEAGRMSFTVNGVDPGEAVRSARVSAGVSAVAAVPEVRSKVVALLREMAMSGALVMEGRDIGSAVFPDSDMKFYLDADPAERARRRYAEGTGEGRKDLDAVLNALKKRDQVDSTRKSAPLVIPDGAVIVETTGLGIDDVVNRIIESLPDDSGV